MYTIADNTYTYNTYTYTSIVVKSGFPVRARRHGAPRSFGREAKR